MFNSFATQQAGIIQDSLVTYYDFSQSESYPMTGSIVKDLSAQVGNAVIEGGSTFSTANGGYLGFNGVSSRLNPVGTSTTGPNGAFFNNSSFTLQFWAYWNSVGSEPAICFQGAGTNNQGLHVIIRSNKLLFAFFNSDLTSNASINSGQWYNIALTYSRATGFRKSIYINGALDISATGNQYSTALNNFQIGRVNWTSGFTFTGGYFNGFIGQFLIYGRALSLEDVRQNYNASKNRFGLY